MQRIRYGLTGLALVFLIVLLGTAIVRSSGEPEANAVNAAAPSDPLSELGVAPGQNPDENRAQNSSKPK
ncbi:hypothetical protein M8312_07435 [Sphingomonas sp. KRR8]|uniref:hypothetical protein n=1 Tax=Sphingomonas sp. KRR8 TaxID=2942996 RepID=UPI0020218AB4|nr:hypothetical protein [Sphingomonas sp. KRR8]URD59660.1 hypothetical protein M8312_07435 [Sphingomonas sp. KRR8]